LPPSIQAIIDAEGRNAGGVHLPEFARHSRRHVGRHRRAGIKVPIGSCRPANPLAPLPPDCRHPVRNEPESWRFDACCLLADFSAPLLNGAAADSVLAQIHDGCQHRSTEPERHHRASYALILALQLRL